MPIVVVCRSCHQRFQVSDKFAGRQGPCPKCKAPIYIPKPEEEVKIHVPEHSEASARGASGKLVLKPIARTQTRPARWQVAAIVGGAVLLLAGAVAMRWTAPSTRQIMALFGVLALSAPLVVTGYTFLRDPELEPYSGLWLGIRAGICAVVYVACWGVYFSLPADWTNELWNWVFLGPAFGAAGATAAWAALELDWGNAFFHFCFYAGVTVLLRVLMGLPL